MILLPTSPPKNYKISSAFSYNFILALTRDRSVFLALNALLLCFTEPCPTMALIVLFKSNPPFAAKRRPLLLSAKVTQKHF